MKQEARLVFLEVAKITPPQFDTTQGKAAEVHGHIAAEADIRSLYGTPSGAFRELMELGKPEEAGRFWRAFTARDDASANAVLRRVLGASFSPFDDGAIHQRFGRNAIGRRRTRGRRILFVRDPKALDAYIKNVQSKVWYLASGWSPALKALGARVPYGLNKQSAPGTLVVRVDDRHIFIAMSNRTPFARDIKGLNRRIRFALDVRTTRMQRNWNDYLNRAARAAGFR